MATPPAAPPLALDARLFGLAELVAAKSTLEAGELTTMLRDGRELVRANAALANAPKQPRVAKKSPLERARLRLHHRR